MRVILSGLIEKFCVLGSFLSGLIEKCCVLGSFLSGLIEKVLCAVVFFVWSN